MVRARSIADVDPFVPTAIDWTGRRRRRSAEITAAGQTVAGWGANGPAAGGGIAAAAAPAGQRPSSGVRESWAHETRPAGTGPNDDGSPAFALGIVVPSG